jgi:hypothetical protein
MAQSGSVEFVAIPFWKWISRWRLASNNTLGVSSNLGAFTGSGEHHRHEEFDVLDDVITSLADLLQERRAIAQEEWDQSIKKRLKA